MAKVKKEKAILKEPKSRAKYKCPDALELFIDWDNAIPPDTKLLSDWRATFWEYFENYEKNGIPKSEFALAAYRQTFDEFFHSFSKEDIAILKEHIFSKFISPDSPEKTREQLEIKILTHALDEWYPHYCQRRKDLRDIAKFFLHLRTNDYLSADNEEIKTKDGETISLPVFKIFLAREGTIGKAITPAYQAYIGADLDRIRTCEICSRVFWAKREDKQTCSPECLNRLNVRRHRNLTDEEKAERKAQREANRMYKNKGSKK